MRWEREKRNDGRKRRRIGGGEKDGQNEGERR